MCGHANIIVCVCVCACVCVCVFLPCHTRKGALMLHILYVQNAVEEAEATIGRCTSGWSP